MGVDDLPENDLPSYMLENQGSERVEENEVPDRDPIRVLDEVELILDGFNLYVVDPDEQGVYFKAGLGRSEDFGDAVDNLSSGQHFRDAGSHYERRNSSKMGEIKPFLEGERLPEEYREDFDTVSSILQEGKDWVRDLVKEEYGRIRDIGEGEEESVRRVSQRLGISEETISRYI